MFKIKPPAFGFGNIVMVEDGLVGVVVKSWENSRDGGYTHYVYVRSFNSVKEYREDQMRHFVYDKELTDEQLEYYEI